MLQGENIGRMLVEAAEGVMIPVVRRIVNDRTAALPGARRAAIPCDRPQGMGCLFGRGRQAALTARASGEYYIDLRTRRSGEAS